MSSLNRNRRRLKTTARPLVIESLDQRILLTTNAISSGPWMDSATWDNGIPDPTQRAVIDSGFTVEMNGTDHQALEIVVRGNLVVTEEAGVNKSLDTDWIHVNSGGQFIVGTGMDRYDEADFTLTLRGTDLDAVHTINTSMGEREIRNNNGFLMTAMMGSVQLYGKEKLSFTKLSASAGAGSDSITVANYIERNFDKGGMAGGEFVTSPEDDGQVNWETGDQIVIASSTYDYRDEDVRTITSFVDNGDGTTTYTLNAPLDHDHYGVKEVYGTTAAPGTMSASQTYEIDMRAEVALLSRNIKIQGLDTQDTDSEFGDRANAQYKSRFIDSVGNAVESSDVTPEQAAAAGLSHEEAKLLPDEQVANGIGGHIMFMPTSGPIMVDGVQLDGMGQASRKGRYPIHWHLGDGRMGDTLRNSSVTNSNNRGVTIHGTSELKIEGVVLHDIHGHGFFFEDAVETNNQLVGNIAFGIHKVGGNDQSAANPGGKDKFVVDTHDSVREAGSRFKSSAAFWITNPDNTFVGNISAGASGTGFWYALPRTVLGESGLDPQYNGVIPVYAEFGQFDNNVSHSTPVGLNFDRGSDIENGRLDNDPINVGNQDNYSPRVGGLENGEPTTNFVRSFTNYKATDAGVYHRGSAETMFFDDLRIADSYNSVWAVSETEYTNSLFVGHSGNGDPSASVGGPRLYDGSGLYTNAHFAGFGGENAFVFQVEGSSFGPTMYHAFRGTSFEADGTFGNISHAVSDFEQDPGEGHEIGRPFKWIKAAMDLDGSLTGGVSEIQAGSGYTIVPNIDFLVDDDDIQPAGWDARLTDDVYARMRIENNDDGEPLFPSKATGEPLVRFTADDGDFVDVLGGQDINGDLYWTQIAAKAGADRTLTVEFMRNGVPKNGFVLDMENQDGGRPKLNQTIRDRVENARLVSKFIAAGNYTPVGATQVSSEAALRAVTSGVAFYRDGVGNLFLNTAIHNDQNDIQLLPGAPLQTAFVSRTVDYGSVIQAEEFDNGIDGIAYHDSDSINTAGTFRADTGVDATTTKVAEIEDGEWLEYTADIAAAGYDIELQVSSTTDGGQIRVLAANSNSAGFLTEMGVVDVPNTGGTFVTVPVKRANLTPIAGPESVIRVEFIGNGMEFDSILFTEPTQEAFPESVKEITSSSTTRVELEQYDLGGEGIAYHDTTPDENRTDSSYRPGEGVDADDRLVTGQVFDGEWLEYTRDIQAGSYDITLRKDWGSAGKGVKLFVADSNSATTFDLIDQFTFIDNDNSELITLENVDLSPWAGVDRVFRAEIVGDWMGIDFLDFAPAASNLSCNFVDAGDTCDINDIDALVAEIATGGDSAIYDLNDDGDVNLEDRNQWLAQAGAINLASGSPYLLGDGNLDGVVDASDFNIWNANKFTAVAAWSSGDFNADGVVDASDFNLWNANKFTASDTLQRTRTNTRTDAHRVRDLVFSQSEIEENSLAAELTTRHMNRPFNVR